MTKDPMIYLKHILESAQAVEKYVQEITEDEFHHSNEKQDSVIRRIEIIGEATKNISETFKKQHPDVPWKNMAGMRNVLIHEYFDVNLHTVWKTATQFIPLLRLKIQRLLQDHAA